MSRSFLNKRGELDKIVTSLPVIIGVFVFSILFIGGSFLVSLNDKLDKESKIYPVGGSQGFNEVLSIPIEYNGKSLPLVDVLSLGVMDNKNYEIIERELFSYSKSKIKSQAEINCLILGPLNSLSKNYLVTTSNTHLFFQSNVVQDFKDGNDYMTSVRASCISKRYGNLDFIFEEYKKSGMLGKITLLDKAGLEVDIFGYFGRCLEISEFNECPLTGKIGGNK